MLELTAANALNYLRTQGRIGSGPAQVETLGWGVSNVVLRIRTDERTFILKQSRPRLRTCDAWFSNVDRVYREQEVMQLLHPLLPPLTVPEVLFCDRANYAFAMSHAPPEAEVWKETLLAGRVDMAVGERAGQVLGLMHEATAKNPALVEPFRDSTVFVQLRVEPFYQRIQERRPEVADAIGRIVERMLSIDEALCHGDYSPKNILTHRHGFTLVDYETGHHGDPTMDLGFFLSHLILKAFHRPTVSQQFFDLTETFWRSYFGTVTFLPAADLQARGIEHFAVCALARIDGTSPVDYLPQEAKRQAVRRLGQEILADRPARWSEVLGLCRSQMADLS
jgi:5-methylthioribose kinase